MDDTRIVFRVHAVSRMFERGISEGDVRHVLEHREVIEEYPDDTPYPSRLMLGWAGSRPLHVVVADNAEEETAVIISAYEPGEDQWEAGFRRRKR